MKIKIWGSRGSLPSPMTPKEIKNRSLSLIESYIEAKKTSPQLEAKDFINSLTPGLHFGYGGDTTCVEVTNKDGSNLFIDAGSGLRRAGNNLMSGPCGKGKGVVHIYFTHFHWDHLMGLPFFVPIFIPGNEVHIYSVDENIEENIKMLFKKPQFPVEYKDLLSTIKYHVIKPRVRTDINGISVCPYQLDHPDPCWGLKVFSDGKVYSHCVDNEGVRVSRKELGEDLPLYQNVDLCFFDAQYSFENYLEKIDWGHSSSSIGIDIAYREGIKQMIFTHHDPAASMEDIYQSYEDTKNYNSMMKKMNNAKDEIDFQYAYDGLEVDLG